MQVHISPLIYNDTEMFVASRTISDFVNMSFGPDYVFTC